MKIAEHDREQSRMELERQEQDASTQWCVVDYKDEVRTALKARASE